MEKYNREKEKEIWIGIENGELIFINYYFINKYS